MLCLPVLLDVYFKIPTHLENLCYYAKKIPLFGGPTIPRSTTWKHLFLGWNSYQSGRVWKISTSKNINLRNQPWMEPNVLLRYLIQGSFSKGKEEETTVSSILTSNFWSLRPLSFVVLIYIYRQNISTYLPLYSKDYDFLTWGLTSNGAFTVKSCYSSLEEKKTTNLNYNSI